MPFDNNLREAIWWFRQREIPDLNNARTRAMLERILADQDTALPIIRRFRPRSLLNPYAQSKMEADITDQTTRDILGRLNIDWQNVRQRNHALLLSAGGVSYTQQILATSPLALWPLDEGSGADILDQSGNSYNGTYTGVTWDGTQHPKGTPVPFWDGANDYGDVYSAGFDSAWNQNEGCVLLWLKANDAGVWTDATTRYMFVANSGVSDLFWIHKTTTDSQVWFRRVGNGTSQQIVDTSFSGTDWISVLMSWSVANDEFKAYKNGTQLGTTQTGLVAASDTTLITSQTALGAGNTTPANVWHGYLGYATVWDRPVDSDILALANFP